MKLRLKSTPAARALIREFEPFRPVAERDADGRWTVGYGHRAGAREDTQVSREDAELLMIYDVLQAEGAIDESVSSELPGPQRDALVSFAHAIGLTAFRQSAVVRLINKGRWRAAADAIAAWGGGDSPRHAAERGLFLQDIPADISGRPVELVIEVEHPDFDEDDDAVFGEATEADGEAPAEVVDAEAPETGADDDGETEIAPESVAEAAPEPRAEPVAAVSQPVRSAVAERVIARMREQLAVRMPATEAVAEPVVAAEPETPRAAEPVRGPVGYVFAETADAQAEDEGEIVEPSEELPPMTAGSAREGLSGEVGGTRLAATAPQDGDVRIGDAEEEALPDPEEIAAEFDTGSVVPRRNGWSNGDVTPAPQRHNFPAGTAAVLGFGVAVLGAGIWDSATRWESYVSGDLWPYGPAAAAAGFMLTAAASISLVGRAVRKS